MKWIFTIYLLVLLGLGIPSAQAGGEIIFGPQETKIKGSIKYSVIGRYIAGFKSFQGKVTLDNNDHQIRSVDLEIDAGSIESNCKWCDNIVRSDQLLAVKKYPKIIFTSDEIIQNKSDYTVKGTLEMHGVKKRVSFPFQAQVVSAKDSSTKMMEVKGEWKINRKDFKIICNKVLEQGGVLVGNYITVNWGITAEI